MDPEVDTVHLGQFTDDHAEQIERALDAVGIVHWRKTPGWLTRSLFAGDWGVRLFVDRTRLEEARTIADEVAGPLP